MLQFNCMETHTTAHNLHVLYIILCICRGDDNAIRLVASSSGLAIIMGTVIPIYFLQLLQLSNIIIYAHMCACVCVCVLAV